MLKPASALPGHETLVASWRALATTSPGATVVTTPTSVAAVFPEWAVLNNAIALDASDTDAAAEVAADVGGLYRDAGADTWALWIPNDARDFDQEDALRAVGTLQRDTTTLVMSTTLGDGRRSALGAIRTSVGAASLAGDEPLDEDVLPGPEPGRGIEGWALVRDGTTVSGAWSCIDGDDCGIYAVGTVPERRRQGFGGALVEHVMADAWRRGARTATLQSTRMAQGLYESLGFVAAGRYEEWVST